MKDYKETKVTESGIEYTVREWTNGNRYWRLNGKLHRTDGPAIEYADGTKVWYLNGKCHRTDGPAVEYVNGSKSWYLNDEWIETESEWYEAVVQYKIDKLLRS